MPRDSEIASDQREWLDRCKSWGADASVESDAVDPRRGRMNIEDTDKEMLARRALLILPLREGEVVIAVVTASLGRVCSGGPWRIVLGTSPSVRVSLLRVRW